MFAKHLEATLTCAVAAGGKSPPRHGRLSRGSRCSSRKLSYLGSLLAKTKSSATGLGDGLPSMREAGDPIPSLTAEIVQMASDNGRPLECADVAPSAISKMK